MKHQDQHYKNNEEKENDFTPPWKNLNNQENFTQKTQKQEIPPQPKIPKSS